MKLACFTSRRPCGSFAVPTGTSVQRVRMHGSNGWASGPGALGPLKKSLQEFRRLAALIGAAYAQLKRDVLRSVPHPSCRNVEANDANWIAVLALQQITNDGFEIGAFDVRFAPGQAEVAAEVVEHEVGVPINARNDGG